MIDLYEHQKTSFEKFIKLTFCADLSEPGTGKTRVQIALLLHRKSKLNLIMCPPSTAIKVWKQQLDEAFPPECQIVLDKGSRKALDFLDGLTGHEDYNIIVPYDTAKIIIPKKKNISYGLTRVFWSTIILDESTKCKNPQSMRAKRVMFLKSQYRSIMTGTVAPNSLMDIFPQFRFLSDNIFGSSWFSFRERYFSNQLIVQTFLENGNIYIKFPYSKKAVNFIKKTKSYYWNNLESAWVSKFTADDIEGAAYVVNKLKSMDDGATYYLKPGALEAVRAKMAPYSVRHHKKDCLDLPPVIHEYRICEMTPDQKRAYKQMKQDMILFLETGEPITAPFAITKLMKMRQISSGFVYGDERIIHFPQNRTDLIVELVEQIPGEVIIFAHFRESIKMICRALAKENMSFVQFTGKVDELNLFENEVKILVANPMSAGHGLNLQFCSDIIYYEKDFNLETYLQANDRINRIGQKNKMTIYHLQSSGIDIQIDKRLEAKGDVLKELDIKEL